LRMILGRWSSCLLGHARHGLLRLGTLASGAHFGQMGVVEQLVSESRVHFLEAPQPILDWPVLRCPQLAAFSGARRQDAFAVQQPLCGEAERRSV